MSSFRLPTKPLLFSLLCIADLAAMLVAQDPPRKIAPVPVGSLIQRQKVDFLDQAAREPSIVEHPDGTLFVAGYSSIFATPPQTKAQLWKSSDQGATWVRVDLGPEAIANSDVSLAVAPDGTLYYATMQFDVKSLEGVHIAVGASKDSGKSWQWAVVSKQRYDDQPWVAVAPDGTAHVIWNNDKGVHHIASHDEGKTWSAPDLVNSTGGSSNLAVGPKGEVAVRIVPMYASGNMYSEGVDLIAVSTDGGKTWNKRPAPGERDWAPQDTPGAIPRWVEPLAWDSQGSLYSSWTNFKGVWLARSSDQGATWNQWKIADIEELSYYPLLVAQGAGELAATWFSGAGSSLHWHLCQIELGANVAHRRVFQSIPLQQESWYRTEEADHALVRTAAGEYVPVLFLRDGGLAVITPIQNAKDNRMGFTFWRFVKK